LINGSLFDSTILTPNSFPSQKSKTKPQTEPIVEKIRSGIKSTLPIPINEPIKISIVSLGDGGRIFSTKVTNNAKKSIAITGTDGEDKNLIASSNINLIIISFLKLFILFINLFSTSLLFLILR
jgi:hypothetical protein